ncbi:MAG: transporter substrate-binding domain-containing protein [Desulfobacteraceae bacterium]|nr:transporter substrate-binding domain-containing protein [Desulfobacteraceae bacterium]
MKVRFILAALFFFNTASNIDALKVRLYTSVSPPYQQEEGGKLTGRTIRILNCIFEKIPGCQYKAYKARWQRVIADTQQNKADGWFGYLDNSQNDTLSTQSAPISLEKWYWFTKTDSLVDIKSKNFKSGAGIGALDGSYSEQWLTRDGYKNIRPVRSLRSIPKMLGSGRIDAALVDDDAFRTELKSLKIDESGFQAVFLRYVPQTVSFTNIFLEARPEFLDSFNEKIAECEPDVMILSGKDRDILESLAKSIKEWSSKPAVTEATKASNRANANLSLAQVLSLDSQWRKEKKQGTGELIQKVLKNDLSQYLKKVKLESSGLFSEIFVMDSKGLVVGESDVTSDYWQGDEAKFMKTFSVGVNGIFIDDIIYDVSARKFQSQVSLTISDTDSKQPIGAITVGVDVEIALSGKP